MLFIPVMEKLILQKFNLLSNCVNALKVMILNIFNRFRCCQYANDLCHCHLSKLCISIANEITLFHKRNSFLSFFFYIWTLMKFNHVKTISVMIHTLYNHPNVLYFKRPVLYQAYAWKVKVHRLSRHMPVDGMMLLTSMSVSEADNAHWDQSHSWRSWGNAIGRQCNLPVWCVSSTSSKLQYGVYSFQCWIYAQMITLIVSGKGTLPGFGPAPSAIPSSPCFFACHKISEGLDLHGV